jgi:non-ribosomal peptide synthetase component F
VYDSALFDRWRVEQMARQYARLLEAVVADPDLKVEDAELMSTAEREHAVAEWNRTLAKNRDEPVKPILEAWLTGGPPLSMRTRPALHAGDRALSYDDLHRLCRRIARDVTDAGAVDGDLVGILVRHRADFAAAVLGILRAGCGFVPLDPALPSERLDVMVEECGLRFVLTDSTLQRCCERWPGSRRIVLDGGSGRDDAPPRDWTRPDPCYVYFTSGSTGRPKGIAGRFRAVNSGRR